MLIVFAWFQSFYNSSLSDFIFHYFKCVKECKTTFYGHYWAYPTVLSLNINKAKTLIIPTQTIMNQFKKRKKEGINFM